MKKFFKKIAKGFREIGRGLKKFFKSKIGRILGTILLAMAIPAAVGAISGAGAGAGAGAAAGTTSGAATGTASSAIAAAEATAAASQSATLGAATQAGVALQAGNVASPGLTLGGTSAGALTPVGAGGVGGGSLSLTSGSTGASLLKGGAAAADLTVASPGMTLGSTISKSATTPAFGAEGLVNISSHADAVNFSKGLADSFAAANPTQVYTSISDIGQAASNQSQLFGAESVLADTAAVSKSAKAATESFRHFDNLGKLDGVSQLTADINIKNGLGKGSLDQVSKEALTSQYDKLIQADSFKALPISQQEVVLQKALTPSSQWAKSFSSPSFRNSYGNFIAK